MNKEQYLTQRNQLMNQPGLRLLVTFRCSQLMTENAFRVHAINGDGADGIQIKARLGDTGVILILGVG